MKGLINRGRSIPLPVFEVSRSLFFPLRRKNAQKVPNFAPVTMTAQVHKAKGGLLHDIGTNVRRANTPEAY